VPAIRRGGTSGKWRPLLLAAGVLVPLAAGAAGNPRSAVPAHAPALHPTTAEGGFAMEMALGCGSTDVAAPQFYWWSGKVYGRRAGEPDRHLFNVQGVNPRACRFIDDPARGRGYQAAARELMLYLDPVTNEVLKTWQNPWTGEQVEVIHMVNDPASMRAPRFPRDPAGQPTPPMMSWEPGGSGYVAGRTQSFFRESPLGGAYQKYVGGKYRVMEISAFAVAGSDVAAWKPGQRIPYTATWTRISDWLPWMQMAGREGQIVLVTQGRSTLQFAELPQPLRGEIESRHTLMRATPAFDDPRPFQTSWDALQKELDARRAAESGKRH
jgi:hypothetical protein